MAQKNDTQRHKGSAEQIQTEFRTVENHPAFFSWSDPLAQAGEGPPASKLHHIWKPCDFVCPHPGNRLSD
jgi:hypothetical protein